MKKPLILLATLLASSATLPLLADLNDDDFGAQTMLSTKNIEEEPCGSPFAGHISFDIAGQADFDKHKCHPWLDDIKFGIADAVASAVFYYDKCNKEGLLASGVYTFTHLKWRNPYFDQYNFNTVSFAIAGFSERMENWKIQWQVKANVDLNHYSGWSYWNYDIILATRYAYNENLGLDFGFIAFTGMKIDRLYPIIGFDWKINDCWKLNVVYPTNISIVYNFTKEISVMLASRAVFSRHRVGEDNHLRRGLIQYRAAGGEFGVSYDSEDGNLHGNLHAGALFGGKLKVSNRHYEDSRLFKFSGAPYIGGDFVYRF